MSEPAAPERAPQTIEYGDPVEATGDLSRTTPEAVLQCCERVRFTGTLAFESPSGRGALPVLAGTPEIPSDPSDLSRALDLFASLTEGTYTLAELLPPLEGSRSDGPQGISGSLDRVRVSELLRYSEEVGLTGSVTLKRGAEAARVRYTRGELSSVTLDGVADGDLYSVFKWREGTFALRMRPAFSGERVSIEKQPASLKTLEVALVDIFEKVGKKPVDSDRWEEKPSGAGFPRKRKVSFMGGVGDATLPFGIAALREGLVLPPAKRTIPPPAFHPAPESTVKVFVLEPGTLAKLFESAPESGPPTQVLPPAKPRYSRTLTAVFAALALVAVAWITLAIAGFLR